MSTYLGPFFVNQPVSFSIERDVINSQSIAEYLVHGTGVLTTTGTQAMVSSRFCCNCIELIKIIDNRKRVFMQQNMPKRKMRVTGLTFKPL
jgi:hypothetical protein